MRIIDADELIEHAYRDRLDSRELIVKMIKEAPTIKEIPTKIPIDVFEKLISQEPKTGYWEWTPYDGNPHIGNWHCSECKKIIYKTMSADVYSYKYCPNCGAKMESDE